MKETLNKLKRRGICQLDVIYISELEDNTKEFWKNGRYAVERIQTEDKHLIAIPPDRLKEFVGEDAVEAIFNCSRKAINSKKPAPTYRIVFYPEENKVNVEKP